MPRTQVVDPNEADGDIKEIFAGIQKQMGKIPNIFRGMAASPVLLKAYMQLDELIGQGTLSPAEQDTIRLVVSQHNGCDYCLAAHTQTGQAKGLSEEETLDIRRGRPADEMKAALVTFVHRILDTKGFVADADLGAFRDAGYNDAQVNEVLVIIGQKMMSNYFNHVHQTEMDFAEAPSL